MDLLKRRREEKLLAVENFIQNGQDVPPLVLEFLKTHLYMTTLPDEQSTRLCKHCGKPATESYMLKDSLWREVSGDGLGHLHLACVEKILGRELQREDFKTLRMHNAMFYFWGRSHGSPTNDSSSL